MRGLALEGGGARGAYHIGVIRALIESGLEFNGFVGTSIGAINAAMMAQGDFDKMFDLWTNISFELLFDEEEQQLIKYLDVKGMKLEPGLPMSLIKLLLKIKGGGINTDKMKLFIQSHIYEDKVRKSGKDFGLVTMALSDRKPLELMLDDIPQGKLMNYIMASASFPGFQFETIDGKIFIDGAFYDNCPYKLLIKKNYDEVIAIRTKSLGIFRKVDGWERVKIIEPQEHLGHLMLFSPEQSNANIRLGYYDGLRYAKNLRGTAYYINPMGEDDGVSRLMMIPDTAIYRVGEMLGIPAMPAKRMLFEKIIPKINGYLKLRKNYDYTDFVIALLEHIAAQRNIERFQIYDYELLCAKIRKTSKAKNEVTLLPTPLRIINNKLSTAVKLLGEKIIYMP